MLVQHKQVVDVQHAAKAQAEKRIQPPEEGPVVDAASGLGRVSPVLGTQQAPLLQGFKHEDECLGDDGGGGDVGNDVIHMIRGTEPQGSSMGNVKQEGGKQVGVQDGRGPDGTAMLGVREEAEAKRGERSEGSSSQGGPRSDGRRCRPEDQCRELRSTEGDPSRLDITSKGPDQQRGF